MVTVERARLGRLLRGMADSPTALSGLGTNTNVTRVFVFCVSAFLAGVSGALTAGLFGAINSGSFPYFQSLVVLAVLMICGTRTVPAAVLGTLLLTLPPAYLDGGDDVVSGFQLGFGLAAIAVAVLTTGRFRDWIARQAVVSEPRRAASPAVRTHAYGSTCTRGAPRAGVRWRQVEEVDECSLVCDGAPTGHLPASGRPRWSRWLHSCWLPGAAAGSARTRSGPLTA